MILIAHRGNVAGPIPALENRPQYIEDAITRGWDVEVDLWVQGGDLWLGHDRPQYSVTEEFLRDGALWLHAKNAEALSWALLEGLHVFWHQEDSFTLTSKGYVWCYPGCVAPQRSILVMPELGRRFDIRYTIPLIEGICSDVVERYVGQTFYTL